MCKNDEVFFFLAVLKKKITPGLLYLPLKGKKSLCMDREKKNIWSQWINDERKWGACINLQGTKCRTFRRVFSQDFWGIIYLTAGWYNMQPNIATLWSGNFKNAMFLTVNVMENIPFKKKKKKGLLLNPNVNCNANRKRGSWLCFELEDRI